MSNVLDILDNFQYDWSWNGIGDWRQNGVYPQDWCQKGVCDWSWNTIWDHVKILEFLNTIEVEMVLGINVKILDILDSFQYD